MAKLLALVVAILIALQVPAMACYRGYAREVSLERAQWVSKKIHEVFSDPQTAHSWQYRISCESKYRQFARNGQYLGLAQMSYDSRQHCDWAWKVLRQLKAAKCWWKQYNGSWSCSLG